MKGEGIDFCIRTHCSSYLAVASVEHSYWGMTPHKCTSLENSFCIQMTSYVANTQRRPVQIKVLVWVAGKSFTSRETLFEVSLALCLAVGIFVILFKALQHGFDSYETRVWAQASQSWIQQNTEKWPRQLPHLRVVSDKHHIFTDWLSASEG